MSLYSVGIVQNVGETAVALFNLVNLILDYYWELTLTERISFLQTISIYTFLGLWLRRDIVSMRLTLLVIVCIWVFIAIIVAVGNATHHNPAFESPTPVSTHVYLCRSCLNSV